GFNIAGNISVNRVIDLLTGEINIPASSTLKINNDAVINRTEGSLNGTPAFTGKYNLNYYASVTTGAEITSSANALNNLTIDLDGNITLSKSVDINNTLTLNNGKIITNDFEVNLKNNSAKSLKGFSYSNYIVGNLRRSVNGKSTYSFPVGTIDNYELATVDLSKTEGFTNLTAHFSTANPDATKLTAGIRLNGSPVNKLLDNGYWTIAPNQPLTSGFYNVTLNQKGQSNNASSERSYCLLKRDDVSATWNFNGKHSMKSQDEKQGTVTAARFRMNSFGDLAIGYSPVSLLLYQSSFTATLNENKFAELVWRTSVENKYQSLIAERSSDSFNYTPIGSLIEKNEKGN
ncbi:MAG: hypothetical protein LH629_07520, partial [Ignavibacteria bacterium]|nr:hypothetical protein [Ignavibacteria bacterium]